MELRAAIDPALSPPLHDLFGIDERLKHALRGRGDMNLADNCICIGSDL